MKKEQPFEVVSLSEELNLDKKGEYLSHKLEGLLTHFKNKAAKAKQLFYFYKYSSIVLAAMTAVVASLQTLYPDNTPKWIIPVCSALSTVAVTLLGASSVQIIWTSSKTTYQRLQAEKLLFLEEAEKYSPLITREERLKLFSEQLIQIWNQGHNKWEQGVINS